ncbi:hypothetical protein V8G54_034350, partial [Vigna mungo]
IYIYIYIYGEKQKKGLSGQLGARTSSNSSASPLSFGAKLKILHCPRWKINMFNVCMGDAYGFIQTLTVFVWKRFLAVYSMGERVVYIVHFPFLIHHLHYVLFAINFYHQYNINVSCVKTFFGFFNFNYFTQI